VPSSREAQVPPWVKEIKLRLEKTGKPIALVARARKRRQPGQFLIPNASGVHDEAHHGKLDRPNRWLITDIKLSYRNIERRSRATSTVQAHQREYANRKTSAHINYRREAVNGRGAARRLIGVYQPPGTEALQALSFHLKNPPWRW